MRITTTTLFINNQSLLSETKMESTQVFFRTVPIVGNEIKVRLNDGIIEDFSVKKRFFYNPTAKFRKRNNDPWQLKLSLKAKTNNSHNNIVFMDCKVDTSEHGDEILPGKLHKVFIKYGAEKIPFSFSFLPNSENDYIDVNGSICQYDSTSYNTLTDETEVFVKCV